MELISQFRREVINSNDIASGKGVTPPHNIFFTVFCFLFSSLFLSFANRNRASCVSFYKIIHHLINLPFFFVFLSPFFFSHFISPSFFFSSLLVFLVFFFLSPFFLFFSFSAENGDSEKGDNEATWKISSPATAKGGWNRVTAASSFLSYFVFDVLFSFHFVLIVYL